MRSESRGSILHPMSRSMGFLAALALLAPSVSAHAQNQSGRATVGELLPDLELPTIDGTRTIQLSELRGQRLLLIEFASW